MTQYSFFGVNGNGATGPASSASYTGPFVSGHTWKVTQSGQFLYGYYVWRADTNQSASCTMALWVVTAINAGTFQAGTNVSSSSLATGQWNYLPLGTPFALTSGTLYRMVYGAANNFSDTTHQFGSGNPYAAGIVNGPITLFSDQAQGGTNNAPYANAFQGVFSTAGSDPTVTLPSTADIASNFWIDVLVGPAQAAAAPAGRAQAVRAMPARPPLGLIYSRLG